MSDVLRNHTTEIRRPDGRRFLGWVVWCFTCDKQIGPEHTWRSDAVRRSQNHQLATQIGEPFDDMPNMMGYGPEDFSPAPSSGEEKG